MKKIILLIVALIAVVVLSIVSWKIVKNSGSSIDTELIEFAIKDTSRINRIVITDNFGRIMDLRKPKNGSEWTDKEGNCVSQNGIKYILKACEKISFKGYLTENAVETQKSRMLSNHIKVDYYLDGEWSKSWYIGPASKDHLGQVMLLDSKELGRSSKPVIMQIKGMHGIIEPRFYADPLKWQCSQIFALEAGEIKKVDVTFPLETARSFSVEAIGDSYQVKQQNIPLPAIDTQFVLLYLNKFKNVHFAKANYLLNEQQVDSLKKTSPFCILKVASKKGKQQSVKMYRIHSDIPSVNQFGQPVDYEIDEFWGELPSGEIVKCQYFVFDPLVQGHFYFPLDLRSLDLNGYEVKSPDQYRK